MSVILPGEDNGKSDVYIDDIISCAIDKDNNLERIKKAPITVIEAASHKSEGDCNY